MNINKLPKYKNPPVIEVVFGVQFEKIHRMQSPHTGLFWEKLGKEEFPKFEDRAPITHIVERFNGKEDTNVIQTFNTPPLHRVLYLNKVDNNLIQLQEDRFLRNWRKTENDSSYPSYEKLFPQFVNSLELFENFIKINELGEINYDQFELTYVNHIPLHLINNNLSSIEKIFPDFKCTKKFLSEPEKIEWRKIYRLPDDQGRLYISTGLLGKKGESKVLVLNLTVRGFKQRTKLKEWFDLAHEWIVKTFEEITDTQIQSDEWCKIED